MIEEDELNCVVLGEVAVYVAAGLDPETPPCERCGDGVSARFRLTDEGTVTRLCAVHLMTRVDSMMGLAREALLTLLHERDADPVPSADPPT